MNIYFRSGAIMFWYSECLHSRKKSTICCNLIATDPKYARNPSNSARAFSEKDRRLCVRLDPHIPQRISRSHSPLILNLVVLDQQRNDEFNHVYSEKATRTRPAAVAKM